MYTEQGFGGKCSGEVLEARGYTFAGQRFSSEFFSSSPVIYLRVVRAVCIYFTRLVRILRNLGNCRVVVVVPRACDFGWWSGTQTLFATHNNNKKEACFK